MLGHDEGIVRIYYRLLDRVTEDVLGMAHDVLVDGGVQTHQHHEGLAILPARAP